MTRSEWLRVHLYGQCARWDLTAGNILPALAAAGGRGRVPLSTTGMTATLQGHLRAAELPRHFTMHSFRVGRSLSKSLAGTAVDEIMKIGGWKTESVAKHYSGTVHRGHLF